MRQNANVILLSEQNSWHQAFIFIFLFYFCVCVFLNVFTSHPQGYKNRAAQTQAGMSQELA